LNEHIVFYSKDYDPDAGCGHDENGTGEIEDADGEAEGDGSDVDPQEPQTKKAFSIFRAQFKNTTDMVVLFLEDRRLQKRMRMIVDGSLFLHKEYQEDLRRHGEGQHEML
jgi:hypothetical protein